MNNFRPMKGEQIDDLSKVKFPVFVSPKIDGIRCLFKDGKLCTYTLKPIPNIHINVSLSPKLDQILAGMGIDSSRVILDGELTIGSPSDPDCFRKTTSGVMSIEGTPEYTFHVFDFLVVGQEHVAFHMRYDAAESLGNISEYVPEFAGIKAVKHRLVTNLGKLESYKEVILNAGYEGIIGRSHLGLYKFGRSTLNEQYMFKFKKVKDDEAVVIGMEPLYKNTVESIPDHLGLKKKTKRKENMVAQDTMGKLLVRDIKTGVEFKIGSGFTDDERVMFWTFGEVANGMIIKYAHHDHGAKDKPREPRFLGIRHPDDMEVSE